MKPLNIISLFLLLLSFSSIAQQQFDPDNVSSYAIIGVFKVKHNAERFASYYNDRNLNNNVRLNTFKSLYYVYAYQSKDVEETRKKVYEIRNNYDHLSDAWLYNGDFSGPHIPSDRLVQAKTTPEPPTADMDLTTAMDLKVAEDTDEDKTLVAAPPLKKEKKEGVYNIYLNTYNETNLTEVSGNIEVVDFERNKQIKVVKAHNSIELNNPNNGTNKVKFITDIFGFHKAELIMDLDAPVDAETEEFVQMQGDSIIIDFPLKRQRKGDVMTMWNVYFFKDAAIMREESVYELNQLLDLMEENDKTKIMIHGHTNGNSSGTVKHLDLDDKNFFSLNGTHKEAKASAKKLSLFRAHTIKYWLMDQGISEDRMEVKGWGGKKMLYDKFDNLAHKNVRVEIEILEE